MSDEPRREPPGPPPHGDAGTPATAPLPQGEPTPSAPTAGPPPLPPQLPQQFPPPLPPAGHSGQGWPAAPAGHPDRPNPPGWGEQGYAQQWSTPGPSRGYPPGAYGASTQQGPWPPPGPGGPYPGPYPGPNPGAYAGPSGPYPGQGAFGGPPPDGAWGTPQPTRRDRRRVLALVGGIAAALLVIGLAGWYFFGRQSASATCNAQTSSCELTLVHRGATVNLTTVGGVKVVTQQGIDGAQASYSVDGTTTTCRQGESARVGNLGITCSKVDRDTLVLTVRN